MNVPKKQKRERIYGTKVVDLQHYCTILYNIVSDIVLNILILNINNKKAIQNHQKQKQNRTRNMPVNTENKFESFMRFPSF